MDEVDPFKLSILHNTMMASSADASTFSIINIHASYTDLDSAVLHQTERSDFHDGPRGLLTDKPEGSNQH